jgi:outer membrane protein OmpA-like peptidoglycan-associated protein
MDEQDEGAQVALWVVLGLITLLLFGLIGGLVIRTMNAKQAKPVAAVTAAAPAPLATAETELLIDQPLSGVVLVRLFFAVDQSTLQADAAATLAPAVQALADAPGKTLVVAGFHDPSGDPAHNAELAKQRAKAVRAALVAQGCDPARVQLRKPEQMALGGPVDEARRVEVRLVD